MKSVQSLAFGPPILTNCGRKTALVDRPWNNWWLVGPFTMQIQTPPELGIEAEIGQKTSQTEIRLNCCRQHAYIGPIVFFQFVHVSGIRN